MTMSPNYERWTTDERSDRVLANGGIPVLQPCSLDGHDHQLDPYVGCSHQCLYCYALCRDDGSWSCDVRCYDRMSERLAAELARLEPQSIYMGWNADPYQPLEAKRGETRRALSVLAEAGFSVCILTKSGLVERDLDLLTAMPEASVGVSVALADDALRRLFEPGAPENERRLAALRNLRSNGVDTYVLICPILPFLTDVAALIRSLQGCTDRVWVYRLVIHRDSDRNWQNICHAVTSEFPELEGRFREAVFHPEHTYWLEQRELVAALAAETGLEIRAEF